MFAKASVPTVLCALLLQSCSLAPIQTISREPTASAQPTLVASMEAAAEPTLTSPPTLELTATVWPPTFVSWSLQDIRDLTSFSVTINEKKTINGNLTELTNTIGYIKEPYSAYNQNK